MMKNPLVSIIIPAYNSEKFIGETLRSVLYQTYSTIEVLIIDDGSTDDQKRLIMEFCDQDQRFKYYYQSNLGVSAARNHGIKRSSGEFIAFLDADDVWLPDNIMLKLLKIQSGGYGMVHSDAIVINEDSQETSVVLRGGEGQVLNRLLAWKETIVPGPSSILIKKSLISQVGLFDLNLSTSADQDFFFRVANACLIGRVNRVTWKYRIHKGGMHKNIRVMETDVLYVYEKAYKNGFFYSRIFAAKCFANMYLILAASWAGDGNDMKRALLFGLKAMRANPFVIFNLIRRIITIWVT